MIYTYFVSYAHERNGFGYTTVRRGSPIDTPEAVAGLQVDLIKHAGMNLVPLNFVLLSKEQIAT